MFTITPDGAKLLLLDRKKLPEGENWMRINHETFRLNEAINEENEKF